MSITLDAVSTSLASGAETSRTWSHTVGTAKRGRLLIVTVCHGADPLSSGVSVTYGGTAMTLGASINDATYYLRAEIYYLVSPSVGANNVVVSWSNSTAGAFSAISLYGVSNGLPVLGSSVVTQAVTTGNPSLTVPVVEGGWAIDAVASENSDVGLTVGAGQTQVVNSSTFHGASSYEEMASGGTTVAMTWTKAVARRSIAAGLSLMPGTDGGQVAVSPFLSF